MEVIYGIIPGMLVLGLLMVGVFFWAARSGQFDDMEGDGQRILMDEDLSPTTQMRGIEAFPSPSLPDAGEGGNSVDSTSDSPDAGAE